MHPFSLDSEARRTSFIALAVVGTFIAWAQSWFLKMVGVDVPWWVDTMGPMGFFAMLGAVWDQWLWRLPSLQWLHGVPDLSGVWEVSVTSSHDSHSKTRQGEARIRQTWSHFSIEFEMPETTSRSSSGSILLDCGATPELHYTYASRPKARATPTLHTTEGQARLRVVAVDRLTGEYFTGRDRATHGELVLTRVI